MLLARQAAEKEQAKLRREAARRAEDDEKKEREEGRRQIIDSLATGQGNAEHIAREGERVMLKRSSARRADVERQQQEQEQAQQQQFDTGISGANGLATNGTSDTFVIRGLKKRAAPEPDRPYDAFGGLVYQREYHVLQDRYEWDWLDKARNSMDIAAGGYDVQAYCQRALSEAFAGLGVFIGEEMSAVDGQASASVATSGAVMASADATGASDDVF